MKKVIIILLFLLLAVPCLAESKILINEFLIDPQPQQVEIINTSTKEADISGWIIDDSGGTTYYTVPQSSILYPNSCLVFSGDFNLNKTSADTVRLINDFKEIVDFFSYKSSSGSGITYQRFPDGESWSTGSATLGQFNSSKLSCLTAPSPTPTINPTIVLTIIPSNIPVITETPTPTVTPINYGEIFISEAMVYPQSGNNEWVEIFNNNDFPVSLNNWFIDDIENGGSSPKSFSADIPAKNYFVINLSSSIFNNSGDSVRLLDNNKYLKDSFEYTDGDQGTAFIRISLHGNDFYQQISSTTPKPTITQIIQPTFIPTNFPPISIKPVLINQLINTNKLIALTPTIKSGEILGASGKSLINPSNNKSLINTLLFISCFYSLLTMISILIKMRFIYEKIVRLLSSFVYPPRG